MISNKLKKPLAEISPEKTIKDLVNGKSTLQNEILGDLAGEFGNNLVQEKAEEIPLGELGTSMNGSFSGTLGKVTQSLINKLVSSKMPGGFSLPKIKSYLSSSFGLGPKRSESVLLHGLTLEPSTRFGEDSLAKEWLNSTAQSYALKAGISFSSSSGNSASSSATSVINSEEFDKFKLKFSKLILNQLGEFAKYLDVDLLEDSKLMSSQKVTIEDLQSQLDMWLEEHGEFYADGIKPLFDTKKARVYDSYWNWVRQDALQLYYDLIFGRISSINRELVNKCNHLINRTDDYESMSEFMDYYLKHWPNKDDDKYGSIREMTNVLAESVRNAIDQDPVYINCK
jgi:fatty acid synthase subunit alpha